MFSYSLEKAGPKHLTKVSFSVGDAMTLSVDMKLKALVPNSALEVAVTHIQLHTLVLFGLKYV